MRRKVLEVTQLLADYNNYLPGGAGECYVPVGDSGGHEDGWPITAESERRMDRDSLVGEAYWLLERALDILSRTHPGAYVAIDLAYLRDDVGHSEVDEWRRRALLQSAVRSTGATDWRALVDYHDAGIEVLAEYLEPYDLWVRWPEARARGRYETMEERHQELMEVYQRYLDQGVKRITALKNAAHKCEYTLQHARAVLKKRIL